jgi:hypothetical protein
VLFTLAVRRGALSLARVAAVLALVGIVLNRLNVSILAYRWYDPVRYVPSWGEIVVTLAVISAEIWVFRWAVERMPVLSETPAWISVVRSPGPAERDGQRLKEA